MTSSSALAQLKPFTLSSRSLFVKCVPAPRSFYERRAVLAALQKSTQESIEIFKKLEDNSSFIAVTTKPDAADHLIRKSPFVQTIVSQSADVDEVSTRASWTPNYNMGGPIASPVKPLSANPTTKSTPAAIGLGLSYRTFTLHIFPTNRDYDHKEEVRKNPLHGQWPGDGKTETFISAALRKVVPPGVMAPALRDWETGNQLAHDFISFAENSSEGAASMILGKKRLSTREMFLLERIRRRSAERETPKVMSSLIQFAEECRAGATTPQPPPSQDTETQSSQTQANELPFNATETKQTDQLLDDAAFRQLLKD